MDCTPDHDVVPVGLRTDDDSGLIAASRPVPSLRWRLAAQREGVRQRAYEIERAQDAAFSVGVLSTGQVASDVAFGATWPGAPLASRELAWWRVRVWTDAGITGWSDPARLEGALYTASDWIARPISPRSNVARAEPAPVPLLRRAFALRGPVARARVYVSAHGLHECRINGQPLSPDLFEPGWTAYDKRLLYATYDAAPLLCEGENVVSAAVGDGWWRGNLTWMERRAVYGETTALLLQLEIDYADGSREVIATDGSWCGGTGAMRSADIYDGCEIDCAQEPGGWRLPGFDDSRWEDVQALPLPAGLEQRAMPPVRVVQRIDVTPQRDAAGRLIIDCGQNLTGYLRLVGECKSPGTIIVCHAEVLEADGSLMTAALRNARATDVYRVVEGEFDLEPSFTYHGFRYAELTLPQGVTLGRVEVCVVSSDLPEIGHFACSDARLNQLHSNIRWSQRGNFLAIPTDCPQRDERLGWTGDIQVFAPTACTLFDSRAFLASWLADLAHEQRRDGNVPSTVPNVIQGHEFEFGGIGWADAATLVPWALNEAYGDRRVLDDQFASMCAWVDYGASRLDADGVWRGDFHLGDWLDPGAPPDRPEQATTDRDFIASAYLSFSAAKLAAAARVLGRADRADHYAALSQAVAEASWRCWHDAALGTQAGCAIAIAFDIAPEDEVPMVGARLAELVRQSDGRIATGFLGTPLLLPALTKAGQTEAAFRLLLNEAAPGWLYQVANGATTVWERWDAILPDGSINRGEMAADDASSMTSFNHYAYGAVGAWLYRTLAGIGPDEAAPGYRRIRFAPLPGGGINWAEARVATPFGPAAIRWDLAGDDLAVALDIPPGAEGTFTVPAGWEHDGAGVTDPLPSGAHRLQLRRIEPRADSSADHAFKPYDEGIARC